jgi:hypothetical protein
MKKFTEVHTRVKHRAVHAFVNTWGFHRCSQPSSCMCHSNARWRAQHETALLWSPVSPSEQAAWTSTAGGLTISRSVVLSGDVHQLSPAAAPNIALKQHCCTQLRSIIVRWSRPHCCSQPG